MQKKRVIDLDELSFSFRSNNLFLYLYIQISIQKYLNNSLFCIKSNFVKKKEFIIIFSFVISIM